MYKKCARKMLMKLTPGVVQTYREHTVHSYLKGNFLRKNMFLCHPMLTHLFHVWVGTILVGVPIKVTKLYDIFAFFSWIKKTLSFWKRDPSQEGCHPNMSTQNREKQKESKYFYSKMSFFDWVYILFVKSKIDQSDNWWC